VQRLQHKVQEFIQKNGVELQPDDASDTKNIQQLQYNFVQDKRQIKWHRLVLCFALNLTYLSPSAYWESGLIQLPSEHTLIDYTHWTTPHVGVQCEFIEELKAALHTELSSKTQLVTLSMDERKTKSGLVLNKRSGSLVGLWIWGVWMMTLRQY